jgi:hypothetical protein
MRNLFAETKIRRVMRFADLSLQTTGKQTWQRVGLKANRLSLNFSFVIASSCKYSAETYEILNERQNIVL